MSLRLVSVCIGLIVFLVSSNLLLAAAAIPGYDEAGHWPYGPTYTAETWTDGNESLLFYGEGTVLRIADVSDPAAMTVLGEVRTQSVVWHIDILDNGQMAAVSDRDNWITLIDISNRANPVFLGRWEEAENRLPYGIVFGPPGSNLLYAAMPPAGLWVLDISNPAAITPLGTYLDFGTDNIFDVEVLGNYAFMADDVQGVTAINISNPNAPVFSAAFPAAVGASHITLDGNRAYVARRGPGVHIIDLDVSGSPAVMTGLGLIDTASAPEGFGISYRAEIAENGRAIISDGLSNNGLLVYNVDNPAAPVFLDAFAKATFYGAVLGNTAFISSPNGFGVPQLRAIDVDLAGNPSAPEQIDELPIFGDASDVNIDGDLALVAQDGAGVVVLDISNPANPVTRALIGLGNQSGKSVAKVNNALIVATFDSSLQIVDISDLDNPTLLPPYFLGGSSFGFEVTRIPGTNRVLVGAGFGGVQILDFTNPASPSVYASWTPDSGGVTQVAIEGSVVAAGGNNDIWVIDFSVPGSPNEIDTANLPQQVSDVDIKGNHVYVANNINGLRVWDYVTGGELSEVGFFPSTPTSANGVKVVGNVAYMTADTFWGLIRIDVSNPAAPGFIEVIPTPGNASKIDASNEYLIMTDLDAGVRVWGPTPVGGGPIFNDGFETPN